MLMSGWKEEEEEEKEKEEEEENGFNIQQEWMEGQYTCRRSPGCPKRR